MIVSHRQVSRRRAARHPGIQHGRAHDECNRTPDRLVARLSPSGGAKRGQVHRIARHPVPHARRMCGRLKQANAGHDLTRAKRLDQALMPFGFERAGNAPAREQFGRAKREREIAEAETEAFVIH